MKRGWPGRRGVGTRGGVGSWLRKRETGSKSDKTIGRHAKVRERERIKKSATLFFSSVIEKKLRKKKKVQAGRRGKKRPKVAAGQLLGCHAAGPGRGVCRPYKCISACATGGLLGELLAVLAQQVPEPEGIDVQRVVEDVQGRLQLRDRDKLVCNVCSVGGKVAQVNGLRIIPAPDPKDTSRVTFRYRAYTCQTGQLYLLSFG